MAARAALPPSAFITKISLFPPRSETKAISVPATPAHADEGLDDVVGDHATEAIGVLGRRRPTAL